MENNIELLVRELVKFTDETPWLEFKHNNYNPEMIGQDISALANSATVEERDYAYIGVFKTKLMSLSEQNMTSYH